VKAIAPHSERQHVRTALPIVVPGMHQDEAAGVRAAADLAVMTRPDDDKPPSRLSNMRLRLREIRSRAICVRSMRDDCGYFAAELPRPS
jgi:hypothetical protein